MMVNQTSQAFSIYLQPSCIDLTVTNLAAASIDHSLMVSRDGTVEIQK